ncbi:MAG: prolyl oligopeptidase family serine peptidase [Bacteroidota bacterium]|nr:prolyl oligopeptidase family serine peptidase [Bacteroidota bacterium]
MSFTLGVQDGVAQEPYTAFERGYALWQQGRYAEATRELYQWTEAHPRDGHAFMLLARCQLRRGDTTAALRALEGALRTGWNDTTVLAGEAEWRFLERHPKGRRLLAEARRRAIAMGQVGLRTTLQQRFGRYFVLYPPGYDTARRYSLVLLLHGNSQAPAQLFSWAREWQPEDAIIVAPEAPYVRLRPTLDAAALRFSALGEELGVPDSLREDVISLAADWYHGAVQDAVRHLSVRRSLPVVVGFSQGGFMAAVLVARYPEAYAGAVLVGASYYPEGRVLERLPEIRRYGIAFLVLHGRQDPIVPFQTAELFVNALRQAGVDHEFFPFTGEHWASEEATQRLHRWLRELLKRY